MRSTVLAALALVLAVVARADTHPPEKTPAADAACKKGGRVVAAFGDVVRGDWNGRAHLDKSAAASAIADELRKAGLAVADDGAQLPSVVRKVEMRVYPDRATQERIGMMHFTEHRDVPLALGGRDAKRSIAFVYLDSWSYSDLRDFLPEGGPDHDFRAIADEVAKRARADEQVARHIGVFYDPLVEQLGPDDKDAPLRAEARLRLHVRQFIACLKSSGAL